MKPEEMINRYVYEVIRRLPKEKRADIEQELRTLIEDEMQNQKTKPVADILLAFGSPSDFAGQYLDKKRVLIGPRYYDSFLKIMKIVISIVVGAIFLGLLTSIVFGENSLSFAFVGEMINAMWNGALITFAFITLGFMLAEKFSKAEEQPTWQPNDLKDVKIIDLKIKKSEPLVGIVVLGVLTVIINFFPGIFAVYSPGEAVSNVVILNLDFIKQILPIINLVLLLGFAQELLKLYYKKWDNKMFFINRIIALIGLVLFIIVINQPQLLNPNLEIELLALGLDVFFPWLDKFAVYLSVLTSILFVLSTVVSLVKILKTKKGNV